ncbi:MAG: O-antigen ligase family protein [Nitrospirae bacterium]|nr:O-antigen ligase family protein [Nitrospirota bacterium]
MIFSPLLEGGTTHLAVLIIRLMILALLSAYLGQGIRAGAFACPTLSIGPAVSAYLMLAAVSTALSPYTHQSLQWLIVLVSYSALLYLLVCFIGAWDHIARLLVVLVGMGLFESGWALVQAGWSGAARPSGTFFNPNFLAGYLAVIWAIILGHLCYAQVRWASWKKGLLLPISVLAVFLLAIMWTGSRGGILAAMAGTGLVVGARFGRKGLAVLLLVLLAGLLLPNPLRNRLWAEHVLNPVGYARWQIWHSSAREIADHPLGIGLGLYQYAYPRYMLPVEGQITRYGTLAHAAHNEYLQMGVELGVASIPVFCWGVVVVARDATAVLRQRLRRWQRGVVVGTSAGVLALLVHAAVDSNLHEPALAIVLTLCVGILLSARRLSGHMVQTPYVIPIRFRLLTAGLGAVLVGVLAVGVAKLGLAWRAHEAGARALIQQDVTRAIERFRTAVLLDPGKALYHSSMAAAYFRAYERTGNEAAAQAAVTELNTAIALNPLDGRLPALLGHVYVVLASAVDPRGARGEQRTAWLRAAVAAYERAIALEPFTPFHRFDLGRVHLALGDRETAEAIVRRAVEIEPNFLPGREWLARLYLESERTDAANREYHEILERRQRYEGWNKNAVEERFLSANVTALEGALERARPRT